MKISFKESPAVRIILLAAVFLLVYLVPFSDEKVRNSVYEALLMLQEYTREHVLLCLVPAFFIAGAIMVFLNQQAVIRYLGPDARKLTAYAVAAVSGTVLAVCSCTVLPVFKGIYKKGAGIGPATAFLYSGPAINVLAVVLTARVLGVELGIARAVGAVVSAVIIGLIMHLVFRKEDAARSTDSRLYSYSAGSDEPGIYRNILLILSLMGILVFVNWAPSGGALKVWDVVYRFKYLISGLFLVVLLVSMLAKFKKNELKSWAESSRDFAIQILPLLFGGVMVAGFLLGRPGHAGIIPDRWIITLVGSESLLSNLVASVAGALMYFATLTEVPVMQGLIGSGMAKGPALALLLAGPSLSLPSLLVINSELGGRKTFVYAASVVVVSTVAGIIYGRI